MIDGLGSPDFPALFFDALLRIVPFHLSMVSVYDGRALVSYDTAERSPLGHSGFLALYRRSTFRYTAALKH
ncbi:hypothetical protein MPEAHAMD_5948 [Methylobacterium frigidaeris]|uniref:Uncharacterized protein n=2 Tax=Methylobacterium frigidaeris TaxID=2038277 RepID=A0AA37M764_9HYPH|nr:hypothetical protein MPEAHAMD_5948 [Methylobacterium frigidaeris]